MSEPHNGVLLQLKLNVSATMLGHTPWCGPVFIYAYLHTCLLSRNIGGLKKTMISIPKAKAETIHPAEMHEFLPKT